MSGVRAPGATLLGPYRLLAELGAGGMGKVWRAEVTRRAAGLDTGAVVALKLVHAHLLETEGFFKRFLREAEIGKRIRHENVVATLDVDAIEGDGKVQHFLVMEYVEGQTLRALLDELGTVPEELCRHVGREVAKGLAAIHAAGAVHRDLKPENVLITKDHVVKVMDLGVAKLEDATTALSQTGAFVGSVRYAAPEQFRRSPLSADGATAGVDGRTDLYALGLVLYEMATGRHPLDADDFASILNAALNVVPRRAGELNPQLSAFFEETLACLLAKRPDDRFGSADELVRVLDEGECSTWWKARALDLRAATKRPLRRSLIPRETALHGRERELALLRSLYARAKQGDGQVALVEGEAGIGKSRLVDEFVGLLRAEGEDVDFLFGGWPPGGAATASGAFSTAYREHFGDDEAAIRAALPETPRLVPAFAALMRGDATPAGCEALTKDSLQTVFVRTTQSLAAARPTIVFVDDLHFAPGEGRALFTSLALGVASHRVLLVGTSRPGLDEKWLADLSRLGRTSRIQLARLGAKDLVRLLADSLGSEHVAQDLAGKLAVASDGNPYFVFEILRGLREGKFLTRKHDGTWSPTRLIREIEVPPSITDLIHARMSDLAPEDRELLDVAACAGFEFDPLLVGAVLGIGRFPLLRRLGTIENTHRLVRSMGRRYAFDHHKVQETLYGALSELHRESYHAAIGEALEASSGAAGKDVGSLDGALCVELAEHLLTGGQGERALRYLDAAVAHLSKRHLNDAAARLTERALAVSGLLAGTARAEMLLRRAARVEVLGRVDEEQALVSEARILADAAGDPGLLLRVKRQHAWSLCRRFDQPAAARVFEECAALAQATGDVEAEQAAERGLATVCFDGSRYDEAGRHFERALALALAAGDRVGEARATGGLGNVAWGLGRYDDAQALYGRWGALSKEVGDWRNEAYCMSNLGLVLLDMGRLDEARSLFERGLEIVREIGDRRGEADAMGNLGNLLQDLGLYAEAIGRHERALALAQETGERSSEAFALLNLGELHRLTGAADAARGCLEGVMKLAPFVPNRRVEGAGLRQLGVLARFEGDRAAAGRLLEASLAACRGIGDRRLVALALLDLGALRCDEERHAEARELLTQGVETAREVGLPDVEVARCRLALLPGGDAGPVRDAAAADGQPLPLPTRMEVRFLSWKATRGAADLAEAKRLLDFLVEHAPPDCRASMLANVRLHREIAAAAKEAGL